MLTDLLYGQRVRDVSTRDGGRFEARCVTLDPEAVFELAAAVEDALGEPVRVVASSAIALEHEIDVDWLRASHPFDRTDLRIQAEGLRPFRFSFSAWSPPTVTIRADAPTDAAAARTVLERLVKTGSPRPDWALQRRLLTPTAIVVVTAAAVWAGGAIQWRAALTAFIGLGWLFMVLALLREGRRIRHSLRVGSQGNRVREYSRQEGRLQRYNTRRDIRVGLTVGLPAAAVGALLTALFTGTLRL